jgi:tetratricopeptide (TPR) repeat protein
LTTPKTNTFLLVDPDVGARKLCTGILKDLGYESVLQARTGTEAWSMIKNLDASFVISAWDLPDMSGLSLLRIIRADILTAQIAYIMIVEKITKSQVFEAGEAGVTGIITHPVTSQNLARKIQSALAVQKDPQNLEFKRLYEQGMELMRNGDYHGALAAFEASLKIHESAEIYYNVGFIKTSQGRYEEALVAFQKATQIDNAHALAYHRMGEIYSRLQNADSAQDCLQKAAEIYLDKFMDENAEEVLMEALKLNPRTMNVFNSLGILYRRQERYQEAIRAYRKALKINPSDENIHYNLARVYMGVNDLRQARQVLHKALKINAEFTEARKLLDSINMGLGLT